MFLGLRTAIYPVNDLALGATALEPVAEVGTGIKVAAVKDPFGNRLGIIENPHFKASEVR